MNCSDSIPMRGPLQQRCKSKQGDVALEPKEAWKPGWAALQKEGAQQDASQHWAFVDAFVHWT